MFRRILTTAVAAGALLAAAPALAGQSNNELEPQKVPACCERMAMHSHEQKPRADRMAAKESAQESPRGATQQAAAREDEFRPNPYWNGP